MTKGANMAVETYTTRFTVREHVMPDPDRAWDALMDKWDAEDARIRANATCAQCPTFEDPADENRVCSFGWCPYMGQYVDKEESVEDCRGFQWRG